jgi:hypothetical protein
LEAAAEGGGQAAFWAEMTGRTPGQTTLLQRAQERAPEHVAFGVADIDAEDFPAAGPVTPEGDHDDLLPNVRPRIRRLRAFRGLSNKLSNDGELVQRSGKDNHGRLCPLNQP